jgi:hypothetical protein
MNKVYIVVEPIPYEGDTVLRVFSKYDDAIAYGEALVAENTIEEFDVYEREVYWWKGKLLIYRSVQNAPIQVAITLDSIREITVKTAHRCSVNNAKNTTVYAMKLGDGNINNTVKIIVRIKTAD